MASGAVYNEYKESIQIHDRKLDALENLIEGENGKPVLIAYRFKHDLERIKKRFNVREIKTGKDIADWNSGNIPVTLGDLLSSLEDHHNYFYRKLCLE